MKEQLVVIQEVLIDFLFTARMASTSVDSFAATSGRRF
jgi:hypothetical protein